MRARSIARELALITLFRLDSEMDSSAIAETEAGSTPAAETDFVAPDDLEALYLEAVRTLCEQAREQLETALIDLEQLNNFFSDMENDAPENLERPMEAPNLPITVPNTVSIRQQIQKLTQCSEYLVEAIRIPELVALSKQPGVFDYAMALTQLVLKHKSDLDQWIQAHTGDWKVDRLSRMDRNIMRIAAAELKYKENVDPSVSINEAVELAKQFSEADSYKFINGILGELAKSITDHVELV